MLSRALDGILAQSGPALEWIIVNDGGSRAGIDEAANRARAAGMSVTVLHHDESLGRPGAANAGIAKAKAPYVHLHDDDDSIAPGFYAACTEILGAEHGLFCGAATGAAKINDDASGKKPEEIFAKHTPVLITDLIEGNIIPPICFVFSRAAFDAVGGIDLRWPVLEDWDLILRLLQHGDIGCTPEILAFHHVRPNASGDQRNTELAEHKYYDALIRNHYLREDIKSGKFGLGWLLVQEDVVTKTRLRDALNVVSAIKRPFGR